MVRWRLCRQLTGCECSALLICCCVFNVADVAVTTMYDLCRIQEAVRPDLHSDLAKVAQEEHITSK